MPRIITGLAKTTELEAVNEMLSVIGESPVTQSEIETPTMADVTMAVNILRNTAREVLSLGWRFNTEFGYQVAPTGTLAWTGADGTAETLNIFEPPAGLAAFVLTPVAAQRDLDVEIVPASWAASHAEITAGDPVFYDRAKNREGFLDGTFEYLYIDPVWLRDFEDCPESFRRYVAIVAARRFQARTVGAQELDGYTMRDESMALRTLRREQALKDKYNIFRNYSAARHLGVPYRYPQGGGMLTGRDSTGTA